MSTLLQRRDFRLLAGAVGVSALGDWLALTPLALQIEETTGSGLTVAALFIAIWSPAVLLVAPAGLLVDRFDSGRLLAVVSLVQAAIAVALAFTDSVWGIVALAGLLGSGFAIAQPAEFALVPVAAGGERLAEANGYVETARYVGFTVGPLLGGILSAAGGMSTAMLVNAGSFGAVALAALVIRSDNSGAPDRTRGDRARDGVVFLFRDRLLAWVMVLAFVSLLFMTASAAAEVFFAKDFLEAGDIGYGALLTSWTLGMALGALVLARRFRIALAGGALAAIVVQGVGLALPTLWLVLGFALVSYAVGGLAHGLKNVLIRTLIHERVPDRLHGRAYAAYNGLRNGAELVALLGGGILVAIIGARWTLLLAGAIPAAAGLVGLALYRRALGSSPEQRLDPTAAPTDPAAASEASKIEPLA